MVFQMKKIHILLVFFCFYIGSLSAQTLEEARAWYNAGKYEKAKSVLKKQVKAQPGNGNYNLWYGVCCLETGNPQEALKYLKVAYQKRVPSGQLYLAKNYNALYMFEEAIKNYEAYITDLSKRKRSTEEAEKLLDQCKANLRMLKNVEDVCVIDSFVVDKSQFLSAYKLSEETGRLYTFNEYFKTEGNHPGTVYETELGNKIYFSEANGDSILNIFSKNKLGNEWSEKYELPGRINGSGDTNYPFMMNDGVTIYFGATGNNSIGGYDIFVTRYNSSTDIYMTPENLGMPYNSPFNDYMYVIDEYNNLGWFASDRYQPEDKVCVYVFIPNDARHTYNFEALDKKEIISLAQIHSIQATWKNEQLVIEAQKRLEAAIHHKPKEHNRIDFDFIINDQHTYYHYSDFKSSKAKELYRKYQQKEKDQQTQQTRLDDNRLLYIRANDDKKKTMAPSIIDLEKRIDKMKEELENLAIEIRNTEIQALKK